MMFPMMFDSVFELPVRFHHRKCGPMAGSLLSFLEEIPPEKMRRVSRPGFVLEVECRGYSPENLTINMEDNVLVVEGSTIAGDMAAPVGTLEKNFVRKVPVPDDVDQETFESSFRDGKLTITAEKKVEGPKKTTIPVNIVRKDAAPAPSLVKESTPEAEPTQPESVQKPAADVESKAAFAEDPEVVVEMVEE